MPPAVVWHELALLTALAVGLGSCSDGVQERTWILQLTTDRSPHTVELWRERDGSTEREYVYSVRFPQSAYVYEDNHFYRKQSTIGVLLEQESLRPFVDVIAAEAGISEGLDHPQYRGSTLTKRALPTGHYDPRSVFVTIEGTTLRPQHDDGATVRCIKSCTFSRHFRGSRINITMPSGQFKKGDELADRIVRYMERRLVPQGTEP